MKKSYLKDLFIATENKGKLEEIKEILKDFNKKIRFYSYLDLNEYKQPNETGKTFFENAVIKARYGFNLTNKPTIADDSGLEVEYLNGLPGIHSKRFYNNEGDFEKNIEKLLNLLIDVPFEKRKARFKCVIIFKDNLIEKEFEGVLEGYIWFEKRGKFGFGYDPIFYIPKYNKTLGELPPEIKNSISHRFLALKKLKEFIETNFEF